MQKSIACLLLVALLGMISPPLSAQQNQSSQKLEEKIEALEKRISEVEKQLQTVENVEKLKLQAELAEANAKLANAEFGKFERGLKDSNDERMRNWLIVFGVIVSIAGIALWFVIKSLIADRVEENLNGFKKALKAQDLIENQLRELSKKHAASVLEDFITLFLNEEHNHPEQIKALAEEDLLQVFEDERYRPEIKYQAAKVLAIRKSPQLVPPLLVFLNSVIHSGLDYYLGRDEHLRSYVTFLARIPTPETYQGLKELLNRLLTENPKHKDLFLTETVYSLAWVSIKLNIGDSVPLLRMAIPRLQVTQQEHQAIRNLARQFDIFNEPAGIKEILTYHVTSESSGMEDVENYCLELLQKHDPQYVADWRASRTVDNSEA